MAINLLLFYFMALSIGIATNSRAMQLLYLESSIYGCRTWNKFHCSDCEGF